MYLKKRTRRWRACIKNNILHCCSFDPNRLHYRMPVCTRACCLDRIYRTSGDVRACDTYLIFLTSNNSVIYFSSKNNTFFFSFYIKQWCQLLSFQNKSWRELWVSTYAKESHTKKSNMCEGPDMRQRGRVEWEPLKNLQENKTYVPNSTQCISSNR